MAANAYKKCMQIDPKYKKKYLIGISVTASLATTYTKIGDHKFYISVQTESFTKSIECLLIKGSRSREEEEQLITEYVLSLVAECCGIEKNMPHHNEIPIIHTIKAEKSWKKLLNNDVNFISSDRSTPRINFSRIIQPPSRWSFKNERAG